MVPAATRAIAPPGLRPEPPSGLLAIAKDPTVVASPLRGWVAPFLPSVDSTFVVVVDVVMVGELKPTEPACRDVHRANAPSSFWRARSSLVSVLVAVAVAVSGSGLSEVR